MTLSVKYSLQLKSLFITCVLSIHSSGNAASSESNESNIALGKLLFFDPTLSVPIGQSCASCHHPESAYSDEGKATSLGANPKLSGNRNTPSLSYTSYTAQWHYKVEDETWVGGFFLDGREQSLQAQAKGPLLNPLEMANPSADAVIQKVKLAPYAQQFKALYGENIFTQPEEAFNKVAKALAAFQSSKEFAPRFTSKYDAFIQGKTQLTKQEYRGLQLYEQEDKGNCAACHPNQINEQGAPPLYSPTSLTTI